MAISKQDFANAKINESFGISNDVLYNYIANNMPGSRFWFKFKDDKSQCLAVMNAVKNAGMSPALFVVKEKAEGYNATMSWGNHYLESDVAGLTEVQKAVKYAQHTIETSNSTAYNPAWFDAAYPVHCVPRDVQVAGNADFQNTPKGTIKRAYVPMTAAATWAYYYPQALNASVNGIQNYGNPIQQCTDYLNEMGAKITGSPDGSGGSTPPPDNPDIKPGVPDQNKPLEGGNSSTPSVNLDSILNAIKKAIDEILNLLTQGYSIKNQGLYGSKTGLFMTRFQDQFTFSLTYFKDKIKDIIDILNDSVSNEIKDSGDFQDELPNGINQTVEALLVRANKHLNSDKVKYDENGNGNPDNGSTDNARFVSWCVETIHPSLKNSNHVTFFQKFNSAGYVRSRGAWAKVAPNLQIGDIVCCADNLESSSGGKEYFIAIGNDECIEAYPWENGIRDSKDGKEVGKGIAKFKLSERAALGCADIALVRVYSPKEVENPTPPSGEVKPPSGTAQQGLNHLASLEGQRIGNGQCYGLSAEFAGFLGGPGLGSGTKYGLSGVRPGANTVSASDIGTAYFWDRYGWKVIANPTKEQLVVGAIINYARGAHIVGSSGNWYADANYGHTEVIRGISGDTIETWGQNIPGQFCQKATVSFSQLGSAGIATICIPPQ